MVEPKVLGANICEERKSCRKKSIERAGDVTRDLAADRGLSPAEFVKKHDTVYNMPCSRI